MPKFYGNGVGDFWYSEPTATTSNVNSLITIFASTEAGDLEIAYLPEDPYGYQDEVSANARLIVEAPKMYEALKECADFVEDIICRNCPLADDAEGMRDYIEEILARIDGKEEE